ncbi:MAG: DNA helicase RecQ [Flavobacteriales bacterium]
MMEQAKEVLKKYFGFDSFRPMQEDIVSTVLSKQDAFVLMPTGGGKSVCYQLPALILPGVTLVISPLISLMKDQVDSLRANGVKAEYLNSSLTNLESDLIVQRCRKGDIKLLYVSPEKALASLDYFIKQLDVSLIAIDEAHCVSSWGHDFRPEYKALIQLREAHPNATLMALTATADRLTQKDILEFIGLRNPKTYISSFDRPNLSLSVRFGLKSKDRLRDILDVIDSHKNQSGIIYCLSKKNTEALAGELQHAGVNATYYHAGMTPERRSQVQEDFIRDNVQVVCATIAFGMGIDKSDVRFVMHYNLPKTIENYYQEIGRGGRDGEACFTRLYWSLGDIITLRSFAVESGAQQMNLEKLNRMQEFAESRICRRKVLLNYFGENLRDNCGNCDVCKNPPTHFDGTLHTQKALSAVKRAELIGEKLTISNLINVLRGSKSQEIVERKLDTIKTYGVGKEISYADWNYFILQMIQLGALELLYEEGNVLRPTVFGEGILKGSYSIDLVNPIVESAQIGKRAFKKKDDAPETLFNTLRARRKILADLEDVPPYIIFNDVTLHEMVEKLPLTEGEMLEITGMSEHKFNKYGYDFLDILLKNAPAKYHTKVDVKEALTEEKVNAYIKEIQAAGISVSGTVIAKFLLGNADDRYMEKARNISFYGILRDEFKVKELFEKIRPFVDPVKQSQGQERNDQLEKMTNDFLARIGANKLSSSDKALFLNQARLLPIPQKDEQELAQKNYKRSGMKWSDQETALLKDLVAHTQDIDELAEVLERSPKSIRFALLHFVNLPISEFT